MELMLGLQMLFDWGVSVLGILVIGYFFSLIVNNL
jgi:hypothetical protein